MSNSYNHSSKKHHHNHNAFLTHTANSGIKRTNRYLAALDFLLTIPMEKEASIRDQGSRNLNRIHNMEDNLNEMNQDSADIINSTHTDSNNNIYASQAATMLLDYDNQGGLKLKGKSCPIAKLPQELRYSLLKHNYFEVYQGANFRHWEDELLGKRYSANLNTKLLTMSGSSSSSSSMNSRTQPQKQSILNSRCFISRQNAYPIACFSIIKYDAGEEIKKINKLKADDTKGLEVYNLPQRDWRGLSYKPLFKPLLEDETINKFYYEKGYIYDPDFLDDPSMLYGSHKYVLPRAQLTGPLISSIILYVNKKDLKESLNEKFRSVHPTLPPSLTLSKIRSIKKAALLACYNNDIEIATASYAIIYFERLCIKGFVTKFNRYLSMAVCILIAFKFNENITVDGLTSNQRLQQQQSHLQHFDSTSNILNHASDNSKIKLNRLLDLFDNEWEISRKEIFAAEFGCFVHLGFSLHIPHQHVHLIFSRLLKLLHKSNREYLKDGVNEIDLESQITA